MRKISMLIPLGFVILIIFNGCAANPAKVTIGKETHPSAALFEPVKNNATGEPELVFCADSTKQSLDLFQKRAPFRQISLVAPQSSCDVMLKLVWASSGSGTVIATSAENGSELLRAEAEGIWSPRWYSSRTVEK
jgi:hypothetical protein